MTNACCFRPAVAFVFSVNAETGWHGSGAFAAAVLTVPIRVARSRNPGAPGWPCHPARHAKHVRRRVIFKLVA